MTMKLNKELIVPVLLKNKAHKVNENLYSMIIDDIKCCVDFSKSIFFWMYSGDTERNPDTGECVQLEQFKAMCLQAMFPGGEQLPESAPEQPGQGDEGEHADADYAEDPDRIAEESWKSEKSTVDEKAPTSNEPIGNTPTKSSKILDLIEKYAGSDVIELFGDTGTGKSKLALHVAQEAIKAGKKVYYLDTERNLTKDDLLSIKGATYKYTPDLEEIKSIVAKLPKCDVVVIDSIGFPILTEFATMSLKERGDALLDMIAIFGSLKKWCYHNNGFAFVTNQPESEFNKDKNHVLRPFGDKSQFAAKEIWKTEFIQRAPTVTKSKVIAFRSRSVGQRTQIAVLEITGNGVEVKA